MTLRDATKLRALFLARLQRKTGWGRNEVVAELDAALAELAAKELAAVDESREGVLVVPKGASR